MKKLFNYPYAEVIRCSGWVACQSGYARSEIPIEDHN